MREHAEAELRKKMQKKEYSSTEINQAIQECTRLGYINDRHFAEAMIEMLQSSGRGERIIRQKLYQCGISHELMNDALAEHCDEDQTMTAATIAYQSKRLTWMREKDPRKKREKALRFLVARGFRFGVALKVVNAAQIG